MPKKTFYLGEKITIVGKSDPDSLVAIQVVEPSGIVVLLVTAQCDSKGSFCRVFKLPENARSGNYVLSAASAKQVARISFRVPFTGIISLDKVQYTVFDTVTVAVTDVDECGSLTITARSQSDLKGITLKLRETGPRTHVFVGKLSLTESFSFGASLRVATTDVLTVIYHDVTTPTGTPIDIVASAEITPSKAEEIVPSQYAYDLAESEVCLNSGAFRASVVMSGIALERNLQERYWEAHRRGTLRKPVKNIGIGSWIPSSRLLEVLEENALIRRDEQSFMHAIMTFRNSSGHPNEINVTKDIASSIHTQVKSILQAYYARKSHLID